MLIDLGLDLLFLFLLQLAQSLLILGELGLALSDRLKHLLIILLLFFGFQCLALGDGFLDHFFLALGLLIVRLLTL